MIQEALVWGFEQCFCTMAVPSIFEIRQHPSLKASVPSQHNEWRNRAKQNAEKKEILLGQCLCCEWNRSRKRRQQQQQLESAVGVQTTKMMRRGWQGRGTSTYCARKGPKGQHDQYGEAAAIPETKKSFSGIRDEVPAVWEQQALGDRSTFPERLVDQLGSFTAAFVQTDEELAHGKSTADSNFALLDVCRHTCASTEKGSLTAFG